MNEGVSRGRSDDVELDDAAVVAAVLDGDRDQYRWLVRRYQDPLYAHALRMVGSGDDAADIVQRAFVKGFQRLDRLSEPAKVGGWLFRITANLAKDHLKSPRRRNVPLERAPDPAGPDSPDADAERAELRRELDGALERLSPDHREAFVLKHMDGYSYEEMAELLDASVSALKMRVHRARDELRTLVSVPR